jgi:hypothetical protein
MISTVLAPAMEVQMILTPVKLRPTYAKVMKGMPA